MPNSNLKDFLLANNGTILMSQGLQWAQQVAEALQLLDVADVIHCDVEPKNFLADANLVPRLHTLVARHLNTNYHQHV